MTYNLRVNVEGAALSNFLSQLKIIYFGVNVAPKAHTELYRLWAYIYVVPPALLAYRGCPNALFEMNHSCKRPSA